MEIIDEILKKKIVSKFMKIIMVILIFWEKIFLIF